MDSHHHHFGEAHCDDSNNEYTGLPLGWPSGLPFYSACDSLEQALTEDRPTPEWHRSGVVVFNDEGRYIWTWSLDTVAGRMMLGSNVVEVQIGTSGDRGLMYSHSQRQQFRAAVLNRPRLFSQPLAPAIPGDVATVSQATVPGQAGSPSPVAQQSSAMPDGGPRTSQGRTLAEPTMPIVFVLPREESTINPQLLERGPTDRPEPSHPYLISGLTSGLAANSASNNNIGLYMAQSQARSFNNRQPYEIAVQERDKMPRKSIQASPRAASEEMMEWQNNIFIHYPPKPQGRIPGHGLESNAFPHIVLGDFGNSGMDGDPEGEGSFLPINVLPHGDDENARELREWEDMHSIGTILRELCVSQISEDHVRRPDPDKSLASLAASHGPLPYSDRLINLVKCFEWDGIDDGKELSDLDDPPAATVSNAQWCLDTLLPAAMQEVAARRNPPGGRPAGYFQGLDVSWTKPQGRMPVSYNPKYAEDADPPPGHVDVDINKVFNTEERNERRIMRKLRGLHALDAVKPPYELRSMDWGVPIIGGANITPPGADDA
ncbi:hypothetical protein VP1G_02413 [Cytospora mali]|uniref:Uncharacterized protein n=1 Tax=Cytospora mali TaxID=578113 RepID=A0A194UTR5_CYTMA|nr:hypothetical protein VP1G_02413 [Valsa mali var. pyri (nom. inval.)]